MVILDTTNGPILENMFSAKPYWIWVMLHCLVQIKSQVMKVLNEKRAKRDNLKEQVRH